MTDNKNARKNLDDLLAEAEARAADLKRRQKAKEARDAAKLGKRLYSTITDGREAFTAEFKKIRAELFDDAPAEGPAVTEEPPAPAPAGYGENAFPSAEGFGHDQH